MGLKWNNNVWKWCLVAELVSENVFSAPYKYWSFEMTYRRDFFLQINTCWSFIVNIIMIVKNSFFYKFKVRLYLSIIFFNKADYVISLPVLYWQSVFHMVKRYHCPFKKLKNHPFEIKKKSCYKQNLEQSQF